MILVLVGVITGAAFLLLVNALWAKAQPRKGTVLLTGAAIALFVGLLVLAASGRLHWLAAAGAAVFPFLRRAAGALRWLGWLRGLAPAAGSAFGGWSGGGAAAPEASTAETSELRMTLDHESGEMDGEVLVGPFAGQRLSALTPEALRTLLESLAEQDSIRLLESYLERRFGRTRDDGAQDGGADGQAPPGDADGPMTEPQAREILGLEGDAGEQDIVDAHRRLMLKLHPDRGGTNFLAAQLNEAKRVLLGR